MEVIKNIINFNSEELEEKYNAAEDRYETDPVHTKLLKKRELSRSTHYVCMFLAVISAMLLYVMIVSSGRKVFALIPAVVLVVSLLLANKNLSVREQISCDGNANYDSFWTPQLEFFGLVDQRKILACYGKPLDDQKFEVTVIVEADDEDKEKELCDPDEDTMKDSFVFNFDGQNQDGVLTLDVGNAIVFYQ